MDDRHLIRVEDAAERLSLSRSTIYQIIARGELRTVHVGRAVRIPAAEVIAFAERLAETEAGQGARRG